MTELSEMRRNNRPIINTTLAMEGLSKTYSENTYIVPVCEGAFPFEDCNSVCPPPPTFKQNHYKSAVDRRLAPTRCGDEGVRKQSATNTDGSWQKYRAMVQRGTFPEL
jgi:hypothetical protein